MADSMKTFRLHLSPEQRAEVEKATGKNAEAIELTVEELEERIAPMTAAGWAKSQKA